MSRAAERQIDANMTSTPNHEHCHPVRSKLIKFANGKRRDTAYVLGYMPLDDGQPVYVVRSVDGRRKVAFHHEWTRIE